MTAVLATVLLAVSGCATQDQSPTVTGAGDLPDDPGPVHVHVHGLGRNPGDGLVYIATHTGLWRLDERDQPERVGDAFNDFMGFTVVGADHFLASGHPDLRTDQPPLLGLIESRDAGLTWQSLSLRGSADFHALRAAHDRVYGWSSADATFVVSSDRVAWERRSTLSLLDFAVHPGNPDAVVATTAESLGSSAVVLSADGGRTWQATEAPALDRLSWHEDDRLIGIGIDGRVWRSSDAAATWEKLGIVTGRAGALLDTGEQLYAAVGEAILRSADDGRTWAPLL